MLIHLPQMLRRIIEVFLVRYLYTVYTDKDDMPKHAKAFAFIRPKWLANWQKF